MGEQAADLTPRRARGRHSYMDGTIVHRVSRTEWSTRVKGHMCVLGKEFQLQRQILCDTKTRIAQAKALVRAILHQATLDKRLVFVSALQRMLGIMIFITGQAPTLRSKLRGVIKGLTVAGVWNQGSDRAPRKNLNNAWRMGQHAYQGAAVLQSNDQSAIDTWLDNWQNMPLGARTRLPLSCDEDLQALLASIDDNNEMAFMCRRSPEHPNDTVFIMNDSAGLSEEEPDSFRGAGAWLFSDGWTETPWMQEQWVPSILLKAHSTAQEAASGLANLRAAMDTYPDKKLFIEVYDSAATVDVWRSGTSSSFEVRKLLRERQALMREHPHVRVMVFWQERALGQIADDISKNLMEEVAHAIALRLPMQLLATEPIARPLNVLNSLSAAQAWTDKRDETFDQ